MKIMCSGWSTLPPFRYALMRLLPLLRNAVHVSFEVMAAKTCCCVVCCAPASVPEQMTQPCQGFIRGVLLCHSALCTTQHVTREEGKARSAAVAMQSKRASPGLSIPLTVPAQPVCSPSREGESIQPFLGTPFYPHCFIPPWHSPGSRNGVLGSQSRVGTVPPRSELARAWPWDHCPWLCCAPERPEGSVGFATSPEPPQPLSRCKMSLVVGLDLKPAETWADFPLTPALQVRPSSDGFCASFSQGRLGTSSLLLSRLGHPAQEHDSGGLQSPCWSGSNADGFRPSLPVAKSRWSRPL